MEELIIAMKLVQKSYFDLTDDGGPRGYKFRFQDFDFRHEETLILGSDGDDSRAMRSPVYDLQSAEVGEMCDMHFSVGQTRQQDTRNGQRDKVVDKIGLRLTSVIPLGTVSTNGRSSDSGSGA